MFTGYYIVGLRVNKDDKNCSYLVHRLVAKTFLDNPYNKSEVNHIDGVKTNNNLSNLEWVTREENIQHAFDIGLKTSVGENNGRHLLKEHQVIEAYMEVYRGSTIASAARKYNVSESCIRDIVKGRNWVFLTEDLPKKV